MMKHLIAAALLVALSPTCWAGSATVVDGGTVATIIVRPGHASEEILAARVLVDAVARMTGRAMPIMVEDGSRCELLNQVTGAFQEVSVPENPTPAVHLGRTELVEKLLGPELEKLDQDGFIIRGMNGNLLIAGPTPWAAGFGAYAFLEDHCGVRWYLPGEVGEFIPRRETLTFVHIDDTQEPVYLMRLFSGINTYSARDRFGRPLSTGWRECNRIRGRYQFHHNLWKLLNPEVYGAEHPDWFPFVDGQRRPPKKNSSSGWQPCMTSEGGIEQIIQNIITYFDEHPEENSVSIAPNDGGGYCNCPDCLALSENVGSPGELDENRSRLFWRFANRIAEGVAKKHPDKIIGTLAYSYSKSPYEGLKLHPNIMPFYVGTTASYRNPEAKAERLADIERWSQTARQFGIYEWYFGSGYSIPVPYSRFLAESLRYAHDHGATALYSEVYPNWGLDGYKVWVFSKLLWNPDRDVESLIADFCTNYFAEAAVPMRKYIDLCETLGEQRVTSLDPETGKEQWYFFRNPEQFLRWPAERIAEAEGYLAEARKLARSDTTRAHVDYYADSFGLTSILAKRYNAGALACESASDLGGLGEALSALGSIAAPELNPNLYTRWVLRDAWQVTEPNEALHGPVTKARSLLAGTVTQAAYRQLQGRKDVTPDAFRAAIVGVATEALGGREPTAGEKQVLDQVLYSAGRVAMAHRTTKTPVIDGSLSDDCWLLDAAGQAVTASSGFFVLRTGTPAQFTTEFRMLHDGTRLYVAARCDQVKPENSPEYYVSSSGRDGRVWDDDSIEFLLNRPETTDPDDFFQAIINCEPTPNIFDMLHKDKTWNGDIQAAVLQIPGQGYKMEFSIPFADLGIDPAKDRFLKMNFVRNVVGAREYLEISNWFPTSAGNWELDSRGWLILQ